MKRCPKSVKVGGQVYKVVAIKDLRNPAGEQLHGECDENNLEIHHDKPIRRHKLQEIMIHELSHILLGDAKIDDEVEEQAVTVLAKGLLQVLKDNPDLVAYLTE